MESLKRKAMKKRPRKSSPRRNEGEVDRAAFLR